MRLDELSMMHASFFANFCVQFRFLAGSSETVMPLHSDYKYSLRSQKALRSVAVATRLLGWLHFFTYFSFLTVSNSNQECVCVSCVSATFLFRPGTDGLFGETGCCVSDVHDAVHKEDTELPEHRLLCGQCYTNEKIGTRTA
jgi:hypothetical protein